MNNEIANIQLWEHVEVKRSLSEATRRANDDLYISEATIQRYLAPAEDTPFALEYAYHLLGDVGGKVVLDYGCGAGENSVLIASHGGKPLGIDISPDLLDIAARRMDLHMYRDHDFKVGSAHDLPVQDASVDVVFGIAILHHLDLALASKEVFRVLKPGGRAIFLEPVRNSKLIWFIRRLIPYQQADVSPFERPLTANELTEFAGPFSSSRTRCFSLPFVNLIEILRLPERLLHSAIRLDGKILKLFSFLRDLTSVRVIETTKA
jgi:SAM-dependent methyltransferase